MTLHVEINVSSVAKYVNLGGGLSQPVIGQNKNIADIRLREGEVNILSGLSSNSDSKSYGGIPGLTDIPVLGHVLFGNDHTDKEVGELMIALMPHIIRTPDYTPENLAEHLRRQRDDDEAVVCADAGGSSTGTGRSAAPRRSRRHRQCGTPAATLQPADPGTPLPGTSGTPPTPQRRRLLRSRGSDVRPQAAEEPSRPVDSRGAPDDPRPWNRRALLLAGSGRGRLGSRFRPATLQAAPGNPVTVTVQVENVDDLFSGSPIQIKYDPAQLRLNDIVPGDLFTRDGVLATSQKDIRNDTGDATLTVTRLPGDGRNLRLGRDGDAEFRRGGQGNQHHQGDRRRIEEFETAADRDRARRDHSEDTVRSRSWL